MRTRWIYRARDAPWHLCQHITNNSRRRQNEENADFGTGDHAGIVYDRARL